MKVFEYCILLHPTEAEQKEGKNSELLVPITAILAHSPQTATILASRKVPDEHLDKLDRIEIGIRPF